MSEEYVKCKLCNKDFKQLNRHLAKHGITSEDYKKKFPNAKTISEKTSGQKSLKLKSKIRVKKKYICKYCNAEFKGRERLWGHEKQEEKEFINGTEGIDYIACKLCGCRCKQLNRHLKDAHGIDTYEYKKQFKGSLYDIQKTKDTRNKSN